MREYRPTFDDFCKKAEEGNLIPVYREILADLETPVSAFRKIDEGDYAYLLESVEGGEKWARYSFLGRRPSLVLRNGVVAGTEGADVASQDPLEALRRVMAGFRPVKVEGLPRFVGGAVGFLGYNVVRHFERLPRLEKPDLPVPESLFVVTDSLLIFDNVNQTIKVLANATLDGRPLREAYDQAVEEIERTIAQLRAPGRRDRTRKAGRPVRFRSNLTEAKFEKMVLKAKEYIAAGDIIQAVLSQRFEAKVTARPFDIYRALRVINPSPYMYYLRFGDLHLIGSSPEILVRCEEGQVELRPIAGTRRRGRTEEEDRAMMRELQADEKERAEHIMLVDLGRNDVGRVAVPGGVTVDELMTVEKYSHVMHLVSSIRGRLQPGKDAYDVLRACFPAGTVTGAPKIRAMEIIEELEPQHRGPYAGAVGYMSFSGNLDTCINIRTIQLNGRTAYVQAGAGIVADSKPDREYRETVNKAKAMQAAIEMAQQGLE